jgi:multiple sugar transport system substrate-binding protein
MLSVNSFSKNKEWAYRVSVYEAAIKDPAIGEKFANFYDVLGKSLAVGVGRPRLTNYGDVDRAIWVAVNDAARGAATPEAALKAAGGQVRDLLAQAGYKAQ